MRLECRDHENRLRFLHSANYSSNNNVVAMNNLARKLKYLIQSVVQHISRLFLSFSKIHHGLPHSNRFHLTVWCVYLCTAECTRFPMTHLFIVLLCFCLFLRFIFIFLIRNQTNLLTKWNNDTASAHTSATSFCDSNNSEAAARAK